MTQRRRVLRDAEKAELRERALATAARMGLTDGHIEHPDVQQVQWLTEAMAEAALQGLQEHRDAGGSVELRDVLSALVNLPVLLLAGLLDENGFERKNYAQLMRTLGSNVPLAVENYLSQRGWSDV